MTIKPEDQTHRTAQPCAALLRRMLLHLGKLSIVALAAPAGIAQIPATGSKAPAFTLSTPTGAAIPLAEETAKGATVLVVLRGFPGYQCPYCTKQVHDSVEHSSDFSAKKTTVLLVYPGPTANLDQHAKEFLAKQANLPSSVALVIDPGYTMTNLYGLRWDAPHETAYPATFILSPSGTILFEKISRSHGDRTTAQDILGQLSSN